MAATTPGATFSRPKKRIEYVPGKLLMRVKPDAFRPQALSPSFRMTRSVAESMPAAVASPMEYLKANAGLTSVTPIFSSRRRQLKRVSVAAAHRMRLGMMTSVVDTTNESLAGINMLSLKESEITPQLVNRLKRWPAVEIVERMPARWLAAARTRVDPMANLQWGLRAIEWFATRRPSARKVTVAILDTGVDAGHPELEDALSGYHRMGFRATDLLGHGTHVAGIIGALINNGIGIAGVAACSLEAWKIFPDKPYAGDFYVDSDAYLGALREVGNSGAGVLNLSIGGTISSETEQLLFRWLERQGVVTVAAMGNEFEDGNPVEYPAAYEGVLAVGSIAETRRRSPFSNTGKHIDLVAPGSNILSTLPRRKSKYRQDTDYVSWSGTSMATPHVAGIAALVRAKFPKLDAPAVKQRLRRSSLRLPNMRGKSWTPSYGTGLLSAKKALQ